MWLRSMFHRPAAKGEELLQQLSVGVGTHDGPGDVSGGGAGQRKAPAARLAEPRPDEIPAVTEAPVQRDDEGSDSDRSRFSGM